MTRTKTESKEMFTLADIADRWGCSHSTVLAHVASGALRAVDISTNPSARSRYIVRREVLEAFEEARETSPPAAASSTRKRQRQTSATAGIIEFF